MEILADAIDADTGQRERLLDDTCGADDELRTEVERLLAHRNEVATFMELPPVRTVHEEQSLIGVSVGPYLIIERLGVGGMGAVYLAERNDDEYKKRVAIKFIKHGLSFDVIQQRFRNERQILANLDHQNIARLLDGGRTQYGPYLVMEYVDGLPIDVYCDVHKLSMSKRLELFLKVCDAVAYAHLNSVVHRDLKPGNILVNKQGVPKLLDFGIAKLTEAEPSMAGQSTTSWRVMTPDYASPEQVRGERITTASDVYSLGAVLYVLLTGHRPHQAHGRTSEELRQAICAEIPERPSRVISRIRSNSRNVIQRSALMTSERISETRDGESDRLRRSLRGDMDNIVLMALRKEPERRYTSVSQFAGDIQRHLAGLPIRARRDRLTYRTMKFVLRHQMAILSTMIAAIVCLVTGGVIALVATRAEPNGQQPVAVYSSGPQGVVADGAPRLVAWWPGDDSAVDASGNGNNGSPANGWTFAPGKVNDAFKFTAIDQFVSLGQPASLQLQEFTIEAWVKYETHTGTSPDKSKPDEFAAHTIFHYGPGGYELCIFGNELPGGNVGGGTQHIHGLYLARQGVNHIHSGSLVVPSDGKFHHVAVTKSGATVVFYVDGTASAPVKYPDPFSFNNEARIGDNFVGMIDELKIYDGALSRPEILASYTNGKAQHSLRTASSRPMKKSLTLVP